MNNSLDHDTAHSEQFLLKLDDSDMIQLKLLERYRNANLQALKIDLELSRRYVALFLGKIYDLENDLLLVRGLLQVANLRNNRDCITIISAYIQ